MGGDPYVRAPHWGVTPSKAAMMMNFDLSLNILLVPEYFFSFRMDVMSEYWRKGVKDY